MQLSALELVDVLIGRVRGTAFENLAREIRTLVAAEYGAPVVVNPDPIRAVFETAATICGLPPDVDLSRRFHAGRKHLRVHRARHLAMYLLYFDAGLSTTKIAEVFGLIDHSTVIYGRDKARAHMESDAAFRDRVNAARDQLCASTRPQRAAVRQ